MVKAGRKSKYDPLMTPSLAEEYAREILTDAQIAAKLGISHTTFMDWQKKYPPLLYPGFSRAIRSCFALYAIRSLYSSSSR